MIKYLITNSCVTLAVTILSCYMGARIEKYLLSDVIKKN